MWNTSFWFSKETNSFLVSLPGKIKSLKLKKIHFNTYQPTYIFLDWIKAPIIKSVANETLLVTYFPDFPGYEQHIYVGTTSLGNYYFVKYMDYGQNVDDCNLLNHFYFLYFLTLDYIAK